MSQDRPYWNMDVEPFLNTPKMKEIQLHKVKKLVRRVYESKPFWRNWLDSAKVKPDDIKTLDDFSRRVPVFDKSQRRKVFQDCKGDMVQVVDSTISVPIEELCLMAATSGTSGEPTPYPHTHNDIAWFSENIARILWRIGVRKGSRIIHAFGLSMYLAGVPYVQFFQSSGACVFPVGAEGGTERILKFAQMFRADTLAGTPSLAEHLIEKAPEVLGADIGSLGIKRLYCGGEPGAGIPEVRNKLETAYGAKLFDQGGGFGISCDYPEYQGMHHVADDNVIFELVDPDTYEPLPLEHGVKGVPVQTTLSGEGFLWFRESLGDVCQVFTDPCPCGMSGFRYKIVGRMDDMLKIKGAMVYPAVIDGVITGFIPRVTGEFRIVLDEPPPRVVPPLKLKVEYGEGVTAGELDSLANEIKQAMQSKLKVNPHIIWQKPMSLERSTYKTKLFEKTYEKK